MAAVRGYWIWLAFLINVSCVQCADECPAQDIIKCNRDLAEQLDVFNALPRSANAQKCRLLLTIQGIASTCMDLNLAGCDENTMEVTENWEALKSIPEVEDCKEIMCESDALQPEVLDGCIETLEDNFRDIDSLCASSDGDAVIASSRACVSDALSMCSADIQGFWQQQIDAFAAEMTSDITTATCAAYETCTDVPTMLDAIQECHNNHQIPMDTVPLPDFCRVSSVLVACLSAATSGCDPLSDLYVGADSVMMKRLTTVGCIGQQEDSVCNYKAWSDCYSPVTSSLGPAYYNYKTDALEMFGVEDADWIQICSALQTANVDDMERCARRQSATCMANTGLNGLDASAVATSGKLQASLLLNTLNPEMLAFVQAGFCNNGGCSGMDENMASLAECTSDADLTMVARKVVVAGESCSELRDIMSCATGVVSTCRLLQQSLYEQLDAVPMMSQALGLCAITPQLATMECVHAHYRTEKIHAECKYLTFNDPCDYLQKHVDCVLKWASGCDHLIHTYLDQYLLDMDLFSDASGCSIKLDHQVVTKACYHTPCYGAILQSLPGVDTWTSLPIQSVQAMQLLTQGDIQCNNLGMLTTAATCIEEQTDEEQCRISRAAITYAPSTAFLVYNADAMIEATGVLCARESTCRNGQATMLALSLCLGPMEHVHLLASRVLSHHQLGEDTSSSCSDLAEWASCYVTAAASCSLIQNSILASVMDDTDWEAVKVCNIDLDLVYPVITTTPEVTTKETTTVEQTTTVTVKETTTLETTTVPVKETTTVPVKETTTVPVKETTTVPVKETTTVPVKETTTVPVKETTVPSVTTTAEARTTMAHDNATRADESTTVPTKKPEVSAASVVTPWQKHIVLAILIIVVRLL